MSTYIQNNTFPKLYLDIYQKKEFYLPINLNGVLFEIVNRYKPIWITSSLLELTNNNNIRNKKEIQKIENLIQLKIIPNISIVDFKKFIAETINKKSKLKGTYSVVENLENVYNQISLEYNPVFIPLFEKSQKLSHVLFYLEPILEDNSFKFDQFEILSKEIIKVKTLNNLLFAISTPPLIELNNYLEIINFSKPLEEIFIQLKDSKTTKFLELWSSPNQRKIADIIFKVQDILSEELIIHQELNNILVKFKLKFIRIIRDKKENNSTLISLENTDQDLVKDKELAHKAYLLQSTQMISHELEEDENLFLIRYSNYLMMNYGFNEMHLLEFDQKSNEKILISFPDLNEEIIPSELFDLYKTHFSGIIRRNLKHILRSKILTEDQNTKTNLSNQIYLIGIPLYNQNQQTGVMIYRCESKIIDIESSYQLYSITNIFNKIYNYQSRLKKSEPVNIQ
jgi:hypothetical protein